MLRVCVTHRDEGLRQAVHRLCAALCEGQPQPAGDAALLEAVAGAVARTGQRGLEDPSARVRAAACGALGPLTARHWATEAGQEALPSVCTALLGAGRDSVPTVRAAAQRAIGSLCTASPAHSRALLGPLITGAAEAASDTHVGTRSNALWALANAAHALSRARCLRPGALHGDGPRLADSAHVRQAAEAALAGMGDQPKVAASAVRACGYLAAYAAAEGEGEEPGGLASKLVGALVRQVEAGTQPKATWNACVGLGLALSAAGGACGTPPAWVRPCVAVLANAVTHADNFKVRVNAATALCAPERAAHWGQPVGEVATALATAFGAAEAEEARSALDVRYQQQLRCTVRARCHCVHVCVQRSEGRGRARPALTDALRARAACGGTGPHRRRRGRGGRYADRGCGGSGGGCASPCGVPRLSG